MLVIDTEIATIRVEKLRWAALRERRVLVRVNIRWKSGLGRNFYYYYNPKAIENAPDLFWPYLKLRLGSEGLIL